MISSAKSKKDKKFLTLDDFIKITGDSLKHLPQYDWINATTMKISYDTVIAIINVKNKKLITKFHLPAKAENKTYNEKADAVAYVIKNNLYVQTKEGKNIQITDEPEGIVCGQIVSRNEFGINKGIFWSPSGQYIAFYRKDERKVSDYPIVDITKRVAEVEPKKYPMAGMTSEIVWLGVYNIKEGKTIYIENGETDQYLTAVTWSPDDKYIYIGVLNREQNHLWLNKYDVLTGKKV